MASVTFTLTDTPAGGVSIATEFRPSVGQRLSAAQAHALEIIRRTNKEWGLKPAVPAHDINQPTEQIV